MSIQFCNPSPTMPNKAEFAALAFAALFALAASSCVFALSTDRSQPMDVKSNYMRTDQNRNTNPDVSVTFLKGDVQIVQGSIKAHGEEATIYQDNSDKTAPKAAEGTATTTKSNRIKRVLLVGKQAHMEQLHEGDCGLMTADANTIDYHTDTDIADMTGHVTVVQKGKGEFHGEHMVYNTSTGEMQSGDNEPSSRVSMRFEPKSAEAPAQGANNCGYPGGTAAAAKTAKNPPAAKPAAKPAGKH